MSLHDTLALFDRAMGIDPDEKMRARVADLRALLLLAEQVGDPLAVEIGERALHLMMLWRADDVGQSLKLLDLVEPAVRGVKFRPRGRRVDEVGDWLDKALRRNPAATTDALWNALAAKPPRGFLVERDSFGGTLYRLKPWTEVCRRDQWRDRVRRARERRRGSRIPD